jgi:hypothetical protein
VEIEMMVLKAMANVVIKIEAEQGINNKAGAGPRILNGLPLTAKAKPPCKINEYLNLYDLVDCCGGESEKVRRRVIYMIRQYTVPPPNWRLNLLAQPKPGLHDHMSIT